MPKVAIHCVAKLFKVILCSRQVTDDVSVNLVITDQNVQSATHSIRSTIAYEMGCLIDPITVVATLALPNMEAVKQPASIANGWPGSLNIVATVPSYYALYCHYGATCSLNPRAIPETSGLHSPGIKALLLTGSHSTIQEVIASLAILLKAVMSSTLQTGMTEQHMPSDQNYNPDRGSEPQYEAAQPSGCSVYNSIHLTREGIDECQVYTLRTNGSAMPGLGNSVNQGVFTLVEDATKLIPKWVKASRGYLLVPEYQIVDGIFLQPTIPTNSPTLFMRGCLCCMTRHKCYQAFRIGHTEDEMACYETKHWLLCLKEHNKYHYCIASPIRRDSSQTDKPFESDSAKITTTDSAIKSSSAPINMTSEPSVDHNSVPLPQLPMITYRVLSDTREECQAGNHGSNYSLIRAWVFTLNMPEVASRHPQQIHIQILAQYYATCRRELVAVGIVIQDLLVVFATMVVKAEKCQRRRLSECKQLACIGKLVITDQNVQSATHSIRSTIAFEMGCLIDPITVVATLALPNMEAVKQPASIANGWPGSLNIVATVPSYYALYCHYGATCSV
ncbi:hypothetical protein RF11_10043 [Thelohanellus kitauei]|uniref:Uncharacterized protein n=1 Tax=Thelohanellus kitauei TaxID=669202 RepID=A0A0C2NH77_THEKT|nr:hypothetical protein RF11_10043 [Thelohanellus kitauei]